MRISTLILAAGKGTRMKSDKPKVLHEILGYPIVWFPVSIGKSLGSELIAIIGHGREQVGSYFHSIGIKTAVQDPPLGTGHAVLVALDKLMLLASDYILIIPGDMPLIRKESIEKLIEVFSPSGADMGILTARLPNPFGYGRIVRDKSGFVTSIIEEIDAADEVRAIDEVNTSVYIVNRNFLIKAVGKIDNNNAKGEYYLTDIVKMAKRVVGTETSDPDEANGINSREQLAYASSVMMQRINRFHMLNGVSIKSPSNTWISPEARISQDTEIWPGVHIMGKSIIGEGCKILPNAWIKYSSIGKGCIVGQGAVIEGATVLDGVKIEPYKKL